jgi:HK97 family phage major capsid protein
MWSEPVVISPSMAAGNFLVGAFGQSAFLFDRQTLGVDVSYENEDDFTHNLACFGAELRSALAARTAKK